MGLAEAKSEAIETSGVAALAAIRSGEVSAEELAAVFLRTIEDSNSAIGALRQVLSAQALARAREIDDMISRGQDPGALAGLPVVVKENCDTVGAVCSAGLEFRTNRSPDSDSWITTQLKQAGAVVLGVSVSDPGAFDVRTPAVTHPVDPSLSVGGSSGGSAAALASRMCLGAIGTDTGGSIRIPSACCATAGLKPTFGSLSMEGIFPLVASLDHVGPMARSVADVDVMWRALSGQSPAAAGKILRVGFDPRWTSETDERLREQFSSFLDLLAEMQIECVEVTLPDLDTVTEMHGTVFIVESAAYHLANHGEHLAAYPDIAREWFDAALAKPVGDYVEACRLRSTFTRQVDDLLTEVDCLLTPTIPVAAPKRNAAVLEIAGKPHDFTMGMVRYTCLFDHSGHPALSMPGTAIAEPGNLSVQLVGRKLNEHRVLQFGATIERIISANRT